MLTLRLATLWTGMRYFLIMMKIIVSIILIMVLNVGATTVSGQHIQLKLKNASLKEVFRELQKQANVDILYISKDLEGTAPITLNFERKTLKDALELILKEQPVSYEIENKTVLISKKQVKSQFEGAKNQIITIRGKISDDKGNPLPGTIINIKGQDTKVVTGANGTYAISVPNEESILVFSFIGFQNQEIKVGKQKVIDVKMVLGEKGLDQVVVIGYGSVLKKDLTGAVGIADIKEMEKAPVVNFDQALAGRIAGVQVSNNDGQPGQNANIVIRGGNSLTQSSAPLYVVDGFPMEDFSSSALSNFDIASITVLKDASATAIYGARGANGVVVIETKKGQIGKPTVDFSASFGTQSVIK
ncbi:MAG: TonB-dependent receptor plug domain-containing protein, partial [Sphingobacterium sp.]|nr:TonB-dependent receptor plug domain-containing protein [Sphingobacterium sp.]